MNNKTSEHNTEQLKNSLKKIDNNEDKYILKMERAVGICSTVLVKLREYVKHPEFYRCSRSGSIRLDDKYFIRTEISCALNCHHFIFDPFFSTDHDYTLAAIKADEKLLTTAKMNSWIILTKTDVLNLLPFSAILLGQF